MTEYAQLWLFFLVVLGIVVLPGVDMAYVLGSALSGGRRHGMVAVTGIAVGCIVHVTVGALGIAALLRNVPGVFNLILLAGALYIAWIGITLLRSNGAPTGGEITPPVSSLATFRQAAVVNLLNPKAYLFMLAIFPQFLRPEYGPVWMQAVALGAITVVTVFAVYGSIAFSAGGLRGWLQRKPNAGIMINRVVGLALVLVAILAGIDGWHSLQAQA